MEDLVHFHHSHQEIDAKIAELEKEEEEEKKKQQLGGQSSEEVDKPTEVVNEKPRIDEVVHSNMVNFENFSVKENEDKKEDAEESNKKEDNRFFAITLFKSYSNYIQFTQSQN